MALSLTLSAPPPQQEEKFLETVRAREEVSLAHADLPVQKMSPEKGVRRSAIRRQQSLTHTHHLQDAVCPGVALGPYRAHSLPFLACLGSSNFYQARQNQNH